MKKKKMILTVIKTGEPTVVELFVDGFNVAKLIKPTPVIVFNVIHLNILTVQVNSPSRQTVMAELSTVKTLNPVDKPKYCKMYGALVNDHWYRAELKQKFKGSMDIMLVDMGSSVVNVEKLFELPKHLENIKYLTLRCSLGLDEKYFSVLKLKQICNSKTEFMMIVFENNNVDGHLIRLFLKDEDVAIIIKKD